MQLNSIPAVGQVADLVSACGGLTGRFLSQLNELAYSFRNRSTRKKARREVEPYGIQVERVDPNALVEESPKASALESMRSTWIEADAAGAPHPHVLPPGYRPLNSAADRRSRRMARRAAGRN